MIRKVLVVFLFSATSLFAGNPKGTVTFEEWKEQKVKTRPVAILLSEYPSSCPKCGGSTAQFIKFLKKNGCDVVFVGRYDSLKPFPEDFEKVLDSPKLGKYIPKCVVYDAKLQKVITTLSYDDYASDYKEAFQKVEEDLGEKKPVSTVQKVPVLRVW